MESFSQNTNRSQSPKNSARLRLAAELFQKSQPQRIVVDALDFR